MSETTPTTQPSQASDPPAPEPPIVDPSPAEPPIMVNQTTLEEELDAHPAEPSPPEVLARKPNLLEDAISGPDPQISPIVYVHMTKPDGTEFLSPLANVDYYERKGFTRGEEETIPSLPAYYEARLREEREANG